MVLPEMLAYWLPATMLKLTDRPELALALIEKGAAP
jgi:hypothetical protein